MVFDGSHWLWYGDQMWVETELMSLMNMVLWFDGSVVYTTGLAITLSDGYDTSAYRAGVRSAIVTGPGLPAAGITLYHMYPLAFLRLYPNSTGNPNGSFFVQLPDTSISRIPDSARYTIRLYAEPPDLVSLANTPLTKYVKTLAKRPLFNTEMNASVFPALVVPDSHVQSAIPLGGLVPVQWTDAPGVTVGYVGMNMSDDGWNYTDIGVSPEPGATSATLDASVFHRPPWHAGSVRLAGSDAYGRWYDVRWIINW
jgi:hypothetical protein